MLKAHRIALVALLTLIALAAALQPGSAAHAQDIIYPCLHDPVFCPPPMPLPFEICHTVTQTDPTTGGDISWTLCLRSDGTGNEYWSTGHSFTYYFVESQWLPPEDVCSPFNLVGTGYTTDLVGIFTYDELFVTLRLGNVMCVYP